MDATETPETSTAGDAGTPAVPGLRRPQVGDMVWFVMREREGLQPLPAILQYAQPMLRDGAPEEWALNYFREGVLVWVDHAAYCGTEWASCNWCWPGETPSSK